MSRIFILYLFSLTLRSLVLGGLAGLILLKWRSVEFRHAVWTVVLGSMLLMPIADAMLPRALVPASVPEVIRPMQAFIVVAPQNSFQPSALIHATSAPRTIDWWRIAIIPGIVVTFILLTRFAFVLREIQRIKKGSHRIESPGWVEWEGAHAVSLAESPKVRVPITVGFWKPLVILPSDWRAWEDWKLRAVLVHEGTHIRRWDWAIATVAAFAKCVFWFNPLAWWLERRLSSLAEQASDEASVRFSGNPQRYAETLLQFAAAARQGHRWIGGVAMAQHKISLRIERVLALQRPGSGILSRTAWVVLLLAALPALYVSAASQSAPAKMPTLSPAVTAVVVPQPTLSPALPQAAGQLPASASPPVSPLPSPTPPLQVVPRDATPASATPPVIVNPDLVGEIRLILAPVDVQAPQGQVEIQTRAGTNRWTGAAVWNVQNSALSASTWGVNANVFTFALTGVQDRTVHFEGANGVGSFSYGCPDCSFLVWENGVGSPSASQAPGIVFQLSPDGKVLSATCRAAECHVAGVGAAVLRIRFNAVTNGVDSGGICFSVFGDLKLDGTPFTDADCPAGRTWLPATTVTSTTPLTFSVVR